ncbi:MAG: hypothetical protein QGG12_03245, partial [Prochlorococcaceae cyanobacterium ETNP18_MAG_14]|nr:hypothetical protein [Prochlorococcaceae cyanobacterium ETNP18_MAG_14]
FIPDGLPVSDLDHKVPITPHHPVTTVLGGETVVLDIERVLLLLRAFWHFSTPVADVTLL